MESPQLYALIFNVLGETFAGEPISTSGSGLSAKKKANRKANGNTAFARGFCRGNIDDREIGPNIRARETVILAWE